jgi:flagellar biosynthesis GTPase FlhF
MKSDPDPDRSRQLLASAIDILTKSSNTFTLTRSLEMPRAIAKARQAEVKAAEKRIRARKVEPAAEPAATVVDTPPAPVIQSGYSIFNQQEVPAVTDHSDQKAAKAAEREAAKAAKESAKAAKESEKAAKAAEREAAKAEKQAAIEAKRQERENAKAAREAAKAEKLAQADGYAGSMLALRDARVRYVKAMNGRLRSTDQIAEVFDAVDPMGVVAIAMRALNLEANPYARLNIGQQSMNLRNRLRGALKKGIVTLDAIRELRDAGGHTAIVESRLAAVNAKREARAAKAAQPA